MTPRRPHAGRWRRACSGLATGALVVVATTRAAAQPGPPDHELRLVACAREVFDGIAESVWPGWSDAPDSLLLVGEGSEWLVCPPAGASGFDPGAGEVAGCAIATRPRTFDPHLLATFPAISSEPTTVVGTPDTTGKSDAAWVFTLLHERFHQFQYSRPGYYARADALGLARGDTSGMWMLNYPFPYEDAGVQRRFSTASRTLASAVRARDTPEFPEALERTRGAWRDLRVVLEPDDEAYLQFQLWQEGVARYVELVAAERTAALPSSCALDVAPAPAVVAADLLDRVVSGLDAGALGEDKGVSFYAAGAGIALVLDAARPGWKQGYFERPFRLLDELAR